MTMVSKDIVPSNTTRQVVAGVVQGIFYLAYPFVIYFAHTRLETRAVGLLLLALYALSLGFRVRGSAADLWQLVRQHLALAALIGLAIVLDDATLLLLLPMLVSLYLFATFAWTLRRGPPMIERFARLVEGDLPPFTFPYCRRMTVIWCVFLAANAAAVTVLAVEAPLEWWALYTGGAFYGLMGLLVVGEFLVRKWWFRYYGDGPVDRLFSRWLPAERTAVGRRSLAYAEDRRIRAASPMRRSDETRVTC
jgi:uncharacterized membrane protein